MKLNRARSPWISRVPAPLRVNSSLVFIAVLLIISGLAALLGYSDPRSITATLGDVTYRIWGGLLTLSGSGLLYGIFWRDTVTEKWCARILSLSLSTFAGWAVVVVGLQRAFLSVILIAVIVFLLEQRISMINLINWVTEKRTEIEKAEDHD